MNSYGSLDAVTALGPGEAALDHHNDKAKEELDPAGTTAGKHSSGTNKIVFAGWVAVYRNVVGWTKLVNQEINEYLKIMAGVQGVLIKVENMAITVKGIKNRDYLHRNPFKVLEAIDQSMDEVDFLLMYHVREFDWLVGQTDRSVRNLYNNPKHQLAATVEMYNKVFGKLPHHMSRKNGGFKK